MACAASARCAASLTSLRVPVGECSRASWSYSLLMPSTNLSFTMSTLSPASSLGYAWLVRCTRASENGSKLSPGSCVQCVRRHFTSYCPVLDEHCLVRTSTKSLESSDVSFDRPSKINARNAASSSVITQLMGYYDQRANYAFKWSWICLVMDVTILSYLGGTMLFTRQ